MTIQCAATGGERDSRKLDARSGTTAGKVRLSQVSFPRVGDESMAYRIKLPFRVPGLAFPSALYPDLVICRVGRGVGTLITTHFDQPSTRR